MIMDEGRIVEATMLTAWRLGYSELYVEVPFKIVSEFVTDEKGVISQKKLDELVQYLEKREPDVKSRKFETVDQQFQTLKEKYMETKAKKTAAKKSPFGAAAPKEPVARPKAEVIEKKMKKFTPMTDAELKDIEKTVKVKEAAKKSAIAKEGAKTKAAQKPAKVEKVATPKKDVAAKTNGKAPEKKAGGIRGGIGKLARELIAKGFDTDAIVENVKSHFPGSAISPGHVSWYRNAMKREAA